MLPMKDKVNAADARQLVAYVRTFRQGKHVAAVEPKQPILPPAPQQPAVLPPVPPAAQKAPPVSAPAGQTAERTRVATGLYRQYCLVCHGPDGRGNEMRSSMPTISSFAQPSWQEGPSNAQLLVSILEGKGTLMPAFRDRVTNEQARDLVAYVRAFGPVAAKPARGAAPSAPVSDPDKQLQELQKQWENLQKQLEEMPPAPKKP
jgi:mono/diheme cytochrome c family protein